MTPLQEDETPESWWQTDFGWLTALAMANDDYGSWLAGLLQADILSEQEIAVVSEMARLVPQLDAILQQLWRQRTILLRDATHG